MLYNTNSQHSNYNYTRFYLQYQYLQRGVILYTTADNEVYTI
jgi:hypothetical protein